MQGYTEVNEEFAVEVLEHYPLGSFISVEILKVTDQGTYLLKICDEKTTPQILVQLEALKVLKEVGGVSTAYSYATRSGSHLLLLHGLRIVIYDFLSGSPRTMRTVSRTMVEEIGAAQARYHQIPLEKFTNLPIYPCGIQEMQRFFAELEGTAFSQHIFVELLEQVVRTYRLDTLPQGLMHADLFPDNVLWIPEDRLVGIVDWEEVSSGALVLDLGMTVCGFCFKQPDNVLDLDLMYSLLRSYTTAEEKEMFSEAVAFACISIGFWRFRQFNIRHFDPVMCESYKEMEQRYRDTLAAPIVLDEARLHSN